MAEIILTDFEKENYCIRFNYTLFSDKKTIDLSIGSVMPKHMPVKMDRRNVIDIPLEKAVELMDKNPGGTTICCMMGYFGADYTFSVLSYPEYEKILDVVHKLSHVFSPEVKNKEFYDQPL